MADKIYQITDEHGNKRLIQSHAESHALLFAIGAKFKITAATAIETAQLLREGVALEVAPDTRAPRKPRASKETQETAQKPVGTAEESKQDPLLNPLPEELDPLPEEGASSQVSALPNDQFPE